MPGPEPQTFSDKDFVKALYARKPTAKQQALLALWRKLEDRLHSQMEEDCLITFDYDSLGLDGVRVNADGSVQVRFFGVYAFRPSLEELLVDCDLDETLAIFTMLKRRIRAI